MPVMPQFNELKTTEAASIFLHLAGGKMFHLRLLKLMYLLDRTAFAEWERPVTYDNYVSMDFGPVLSSTYDLIRKRNPESKYWNEHIEPATSLTLQLKQVPKIRKLSQAEIDLIHHVYNTYRKTSRWDLSDLTHDLPEYKNPHGSSIPITLTELLSALNYGPEDIERISSELQDEAYINALFGD